MHYYTSLFALVGALVLPTITGSPVSPRDNITRDTASYSAVSLSSHNTYRQKHSAANLTWDATLAGYAATSANTCNLGIDMRPGGGGYGQNFDYKEGTALSATNNPDTFVSQAVTGWYDQEKNFETSYGKPSPSTPTSADKKYTSFTQLVWKGSRKVGCASNFCATGTVEGFFVPLWVTFCNYSPRGNAAGEYADNVSQS